MTAPAQQQPAHEPTDEEAARAAIAGIPGSIDAEGGHTIIGRAAYRAILAATHRQRSRDLEIVNAILRSAQQVHASCVAAVQAAQASGNRAVFNDAAPKSLQAEGMVRALAGAADKIKSPPGACARCHGTKKVPSERGIVLAGGAPAPVDCPACAAPAEATTP